MLPEEEDKIPIKTYDQLLNAEVYLPNGDGMKRGNITAYKHDSGGNLLGNSHPNPLLNTHMHQVTFSDGTIQEYAANIIAEAIYSEHDEDGHKYLLLKEIIDHCTLKKQYQKKMQ